MTSPGRNLYVYPQQADDEVPGNVTGVEVASHVTTLPSKVFKDCILLTRVINLPFGLTVIGEDAFNNCQALRTISIPSSVQVIRSGAFCDCSSLETVDLPEGLKIIPHACFIRCTSLAKASVPSTVVDISVNAFWDCHSLSAVNLPIGLETIGKGAFGNCKGLTKILVPSTVISIDMMAFSQCTNLETVEISIVSGELQTIQRYAFSGCKSLKCVALPKDPSCGVDPFAFYQCNQLTQSFECDGAYLNYRLRNRFEGLPAHAFSYQEVHDSMYHSTGVSKLQDNELMYPTDNTDAFGFTPFHILALSSSPIIKTLQELLKQTSRPSDLLWQFDRLGNTALRYAIENNSTDAPTFVKTILHALVDHRVKYLGLETWRALIAEKLNCIFEGDLSGETEGQIVTLFAALHLHERTEVVSLLDHAVWKHKMAQIQMEKCSLEGNRDVKRLKTEATTIDPVVRQHCKLNSGAETIIFNVLKYLDSIDKIIEF